MPKNTDKPYVLRVAEMIYLKIVDIKKQNSQINNIQAFEIFMTTKDFDFISSGEYHDQWFAELKENNFIDKITKKKINDETIKLRPFLSKRDCVSNFCSASLIGVLDTPNLSAKSISTKRSPGLNTPVSIDSRIKA